jgi:hypothetical protein
MAQSPLAILDKTIKIRNVEYMKHILTITACSVFLFFGVTFPVDAQSDPFAYNPDPSVWNYGYPSYGANTGANYGYTSGYNTGYQTPQYSYGRPTSHNYYTPTTQQPSHGYGGYGGGYGTQPNAYNTQSYQNQPSTMQNPYVQAHYREKAAQSAWSFDMSGNNTTARTGGSYSAPIVLPYVHVDLYGGRNDAYGFFGVQQL